MRSHKETELVETTGTNFFVTHC